MKVKLIITCLLALAFTSFSFARPTGTTQPYDYQVTADDGTLFNVHVELTAANGAESVTISSPTNAFSTAYLNISQTMGGYTMPAYEVYGDFTTNTANDGTSHTYWVNITVSFNSPQNSAVTINRTN